MDDLGEFDPQDYPQKLTLTVLVRGGIPALRLIHAKDMLAAGLQVDQDMITLVVTRATERDIRTYGTA